MEIGNIVYPDGVICTAREGIYQKVIGDGKTPPDDFTSLGNVNFHRSPAATVEKDGRLKVSAVAATASFRFSNWMADWFRISGAKVIIGKGGMSEEDYRTLFVPVGAIYLTTVGYGTGSLLGRGIKRVRSAHWLDELGIAQAMCVLEVKQLGRC